jgi:hypothetical protein
VQAARIGSISSYVASAVDAELNSRSDGDGEGGGFVSRRKGEGGVMAGLSRKRMGPLCSKAQRFGWLGIH